MTAIPAEALALMAPCPKCLSREHITESLDFDWTVDSSCACYDDEDMVRGIGHSREQARASWNEMATERMGERWRDYEAPDAVLEWYRVRARAEAETVAARLEALPGHGLGHNPKADSIILAALADAWEAGAEAALAAAGSLNGIGDDAIVHRVNPYRAKS